MAPGRKVDPFYDAHFTIVATKDDKLKRRIYSRNYCGTDLEHCDNRLASHLAGAEKCKKAPVTAHTGAHILMAAKKSGKQAAPDSESDESPETVSDAVATVTCAEPSSSKPPKKKQKQSRQNTMSTLFLDSEHNWVHLELVDMLMSWSYSGTLLINGWEDELHRSLYGTAAARVDEPTIVMGLHDVMGNRGNASKVLSPMSLPAVPTSLHTRPSSSLLHLRRCALYLSSSSFPAAHPSLVDPSRLTPPFLALDQTVSLATVSGEWEEAARDVLWVLCRLCAAAEARAIKA
ncbi:hypothetical protein GGX14DRAFT_562111 [Mycena pura]|uniref:Uncharacterized protein n=1 Tax=Mycena pura TaxID=153505 RepID=A0AAD6VPU5_9AGAR|nr:hypothetical protein GGX14DRAFT_562111 [Mycena pura]